MATQQAIPATNKSAISVFAEMPSVSSLPAAFALLGIEVLFRMHRLLGGDRAPRDDAVSAS